MQDLYVAEDDFWKDLPDENSIGYSMAKKNLIIQLQIFGV